MNPSPYRAPFTSAHLRANIVKILLVAGAVLAALSLFAEAISLATPPLTDDQDIGANPMGAVLMFGQFLLALAELVIYVSTVVFFCMWLFRSYNNLRAINPSRRLNNSAGWAVGSFFIPFLNLVAPYRAVKEVWQKSGPPDEAILSEPSPPAWFPLWWLFWLLASFAGNAAFRSSFNENVTDSAATITSMVAGGLSIIAAFFAFLVVDAIDDRQEEASQRLGVGKFQGPPPPPSELGLQNEPVVS